MRGPSTALSSAGPGRGLWIRATSARDGDDVTGGRQAPPTLTGRLASHLRKGARLGLAAGAWGTCGARTALALQSWVTFGGSTAIRSKIRFMRRWFPAAPRANAARGGIGRYVSSRPRKAGIGGESHRRMSRDSSYCRCGICSNQTMQGTRYEK